MALFEDVGKAATSPAGLLTGLGALLLAPVIAPAVRDGLPPAARAVLRVGITVYRETVEPIRHALHDLVTEAQLELAASSPPAQPERQPKVGRGKAQHGKAESV